MEYTFASYQIAEMAVDIEKEGFKFYQRLAAYSSELRIKQLFLSLAQDEKMHESAFAGIAKDARAAKEVHGYSIDIAEMMKNGINKLKGVMANAFPADREIDMHQALAIAMNNEVLAVKVYTEIANAYSEQFSKVLEKIIAEENSHLKKLQDLKLKLGI